MDATGALLARYTQGGGIDEPMAELRGGTTGYYQQDSLGSVTSMTGATGSQLSSDTYDSFGNLTNSAGSFINPFQYTGRDFDSQTGLRYYRARYYDSAIGRFISEDPAQAGDDFYVYANDNPTNLVDPFGLRACEIPIPGGQGEVIPFPCPDPKPALSFCARFPFLCALAAPLFPMNGGDLGPVRCAVEAGAPGCSGPYPSQVLNYHHNKAIKDCPGNCKPCDPPVGTISYRLDTSKHTHQGVPTPHWHLYVMLQNPWNSQR